LWGCFLGGFGGWGFLLRDFFVFNLGHFYFLCFSWEFELIELQCFFWNLTDFSHVLYRRERKCDKSEGDETK
jgi:hypothetical protein